MRYEFTEGPGGLVLVLRDQLTFSDREAFDGVIERIVRSGGRQAAIDLNQLDYMDSAGLGMLLTLRDGAERAGIEVRLTRAKGEVKELLTLACFDSLFVIED
ncbi:MAG: STAS domain-containing protein [Magnetospirillum sp.]|nr:STAS domain-containing protein [Magnetospirillum sp.]